ncbi:integrase core domain [Plakobranchus ocellatus]|uniref:Integrase core domain n=1 Tax=Plakobranchus ocellatus TaxID=259542 RepID=A0AAV3ZET6_9GAST|nr:integrase core domain [Plakobranchus ocellatus]
MKREEAERAEEERERGGEFQLKRAEAERQIELELEKLHLQATGAKANQESEAGHRFILTHVEYAIRYVERVPLQKIDADTVTEALVDIYSGVGIVEEMLSDQEKRFMYIAYVFPVLQKLPFYYKQLSDPPST